MVTVTGLDGVGFFGKRLVGNRAGAAIARQEIGGALEPENSYYIDNFLINYKNILTNYKQWFIYFLSQ
jgi:hypothetical protein